MNLRCPGCLSEEAALIDRQRSMECGNCGARFDRDDAFVTVADAERAAQCTCSEVRGCPQCFERAEGLLGTTVRDSEGRQWTVVEIGEKDCFPTIRGDRYWDRLEAVTVIQGPRTPPLLGRICKAGASLLLRSLSRARPPRPAGPPRYSHAPRAGRGHRLPRRAGPRLRSDRE